MSAGTDQDRDAGAVATAPVLLHGANTAAPLTVALGPGTAVVVSRPKPHREGPNEDAVAVLPVDGERAVLAVADGLGGHVDGELASRLVLEELAGRVRDLDAGELRGPILDAIERANRRLVVELPGAGTTIVVAEIDGCRVRTYHVGDAAALVFGQRGRLKLRTVDHSPVGYAVEAGILDEAEALRHAQRHVVSNVVGESEMRIEVGAHLALAARDTVILASDGLGDNLAGEEIIELARCGSIARAAGRLLERASSRMTGIEEPTRPSKPDDLSFVVYRPRTAARSRSRRS